MRKIEKGQEPAEWEEYRNSPDASFDASGAKSAKEKLREALLKEQGYICAYCQRRITPANDTRIEHLISQSVLKGEQRDKDPANPADKWWFDDKARYYGQFDEMCYNNLVICCDGNITGSKYGRQNEEDFHCDRSKKEHCVHFDIFSQPFIDTIYYETGSGCIKSSNPDYNKELDEMLNLNLFLLRRNRLEVAQAVKDVLNKKGWKRSVIMKMLEKYETPCEGGYMQPYNGFVTWYLRKALRRVGP